MKSASFSAFRRTGVALATGLAAMPIAYAFVRFVERALYPTPNPAVIIWSDRSAFIFRAATAAYVGGAAAFGAFAVAARSEARADSVLRAVLVASAIAMLITAAWLP